HIAEAFRATAIITVAKHDAVKPVEAAEIDLIVEPKRSGVCQRMREGVRVAIAERRGFEATPVWPGRNHRLVQGKVFLGHNLEFQCQAGQAKAEPHSRTD